MPKARWSPVPLSPICAPVTSGGPSRKPVVEARAASALRDVLVDLAVLVGAGAEALDRRDDHARIELVDVLPGEAHAVERAGRKVLHQHVAVPDQALDDLLALRVLAVDGDRALVAVEHREIEAVGAFHVAQLPARDVADAGPLDLDHVGAHVAEELRAGRSRLHVGEVEDLHAVERLAGLAERLAGGLREPVARLGLRRRLLRLQLHDLLRGGLGFGLRLLRFLADCHCRSLCSGCHARASGHPVLTDGPVFTGSPLSRGRQQVDSSISCEARFAG